MNRKYVIGFIADYLNNLYSVNLNGKLSKCCTRARSHSSGFSNTVIYSTLKEYCGITNLKIDMGDLNKVFSGRMSARYLI